MLPLPGKDNLTLSHHIKTGLLIVAWYMSSSLSNNSNKLILNELPKPILLTIAQLFFISLFSCITLLLNKRFTIFSRSQILKIIPLGLANFISHVFAYIALQDIPVSFVNTIKAISPFLTVLLSFVIFGETHSFAVLITLVPIVSGVTLTTFSETASFTGVVFTLMSTVVLVSQNIYSKHIFKTEKVDQIGLVMHVTGIALITNLPLYLFFDLDNSIPEPLEADAQQRLAFYFIVNGFCHFTQHVIAYTILSQVAPVTYSVANSLKRVFVIIVAIIWEQNPITFTNALGTFISLTGVILYNRAKTLEKLGKQTPIKFV